MSEETMIIALLSATSAWVLIPASWPRISRSRPRSRPMPDAIPRRSRRSPTVNRARGSVSSIAQRYNAPASPVQSALLASGRPANDHLEDGRVQRLGKGAAEPRPFRPGDARMAGSPPRPLEPDVGARLQEKVRADRKGVVGRKRV